MRWPRLFRGKLKGAERLYLTYCVYRRTAHRRCYWPVRLRVFFSPLCVRQKGVPAIGAVFARFSQDVRPESRRLFKTTTTGGTKRKIDNSPRHMPDIA